MSRLVKVSWQDWDRGTDLKCQLNIEIRYETWDPYHEEEYRILATEKKLILEEYTNEEYTYEVHGLPH